MNTTSHSPSSPAEEQLARLTDAAYQVILRHGFKGSFLDVQLDLWAALRRVMEKEVVPTGVRGSRGRFVRESKSPRREAEPCPA